MPGRATLSRRARGAGPPILKPNTQPGWARWHFALTRGVGRKISGRGSDYKLLFAIVGKPDQIYHRCYVAFRVYNGILEYRFRPPVGPKPGVRPPNIPVP